MDTRRFYGIRVPPVEESEDSCLSDSDSEYSPDTVHAAPSDQSGQSGSDTDEEGETEEPSTSSARSFLWKQVNHPRTCHPQWEDGLPDPPDEPKAPIAYFRYFFDDKLLEEITDQSNLYAVQKNANKALCLTRAELEQFLGATMYMSIYRLPRSRMYWNREMRVEKVAEVMSRDRWQAIKNSLHFNDNNLLQANAGKDRLFKIRPLIDNLLLKFQILPKSQMLVVDEQIVPFKGRSSLKQYVPSKPHKWGYKIFVLCDTHGLVSDFSIYTGDIRPVPGLPDLGASSNVALELSRSIPENKSYLLFFDNWFTSIKLLVNLHQRGIPAMGTARANRISGCRLPSDAEMKKNGRGSHVERQATIEGVEVRVVKWYDSRGVNIASTFGSAQPLGSCQRYDRKKKERCEVEQPAIVKAYNTFMGGVDLLDGLMAYYRIFLKSKKFYLRFFFHFVDMAVVSSWLLYRRDCDALGIPKKHQLDLVAFKASLASCLCNQNKDVMKKRGRPSLSVEGELEKKKRRGPAAPTPNAEVRQDNVGHWPEVSQQRQRCKMPGCKGQPVSFCTKCKVHLCIKKSSNCFISFHKN
nr:piggyBac transposable element-derived protein 2-like [Dermacentor andersoni]